MSIIWDDSYLLHLPVIDAQHKQIVAVLNELESAMAGDITSAEVDALLLRLQQYTARHFAIEERHMEESNYPGLARQRAAHREFGEIFARLASDYHRGGLSHSLVNCLHRELSQWVQQHVTGIDQSFGRYYHHYRQELPGNDQPPS